MVLAYPPQRMILLHSTNSSNPPQGSIPIIDENNLIATFPPIADNDYQFYKFYQINKGQVPTTQTNQPMVIIDNVGANKFQLPGAIDIRAFDSSGSPLDYEIQSADSDTGEFILWINMTTVKDLEFVQLTFGNSSALDEQTTAVYDLNYAMVLHLNENVTGSGTLLDSTLNNNNAVNNNTGQTDGKIGKTRFFDGTNSLEVTDSASLNITDEITLSAWVSSNANGLIIAKDNGPGGPGGIRPYHLRRLNAPADANVRLSLGMGDIVTLTGDTTLSTNVFDYMVVTYDGVEMKVYVNGILDTSQNELGSIDTSAISVFIGKRGDDLFELIGTIDEPRISNIARDADWIKTEFNNQNDNDVFWDKKQLLTNGETNFLVDDQGRRIEVLTV